MFLKVCLQLSLAYFLIMAEHGFLPYDLIGLRKSWDSIGINVLEDTFFQEWTYEARKILSTPATQHFFTAIVVVQWADLIICKTRILSIFSHGINNWFLNFGLLLETCLAAFLSYTPGTEKVLHMFPLKLHLWFPGLPFSILILIYDECRKVILRNFFHYLIKCPFRIYKNNNYNKLFHIISEFHGKLKFPVCS